MATGGRPAAAVPGLAVAAPRRGRGSLMRAPYWLMAPSLALLAIVVFLPMAVAFLISFSGLNENSIGDWTQAPWVGLKHYVDTLSPDGAFTSSLIDSVKASAVFSLLTTVVITPIGVGAALLLNGPIRGRAFLRGLMLLPYVIPTFVNAVLWRLIFMNGTGVADQLLAALHLGSRDTFWLIGPRSLWALVIADVWAAWPFIYLMTLAALQTIPAELYDAAAIDGARGLRVFRHVTLPLIRGTLGLAVVLSTINHFNNFTLPFVMFGASPPDQVDVLPLNIYVNSFITFNFGLGAAMSVVALFVMLTPAVIYLRAARVGETD
jgi:multiple sugar transport system permease protein